MTFRTKLLSSACLIALSTGAVQAQGLSAPNTGWTGGYVGGLIGVGFGSNRMQEDISGGPGAFSPAGTVYRLSGTGAVFGAYLGYNWQVSPTGLVGIEADLTYNTASGSAGTFSFGVTANGKSQFAGSLRARAGLVVDRALFYVTGGLALGNPSITIDQAGFPSPARQNSLRAGFVVGLGTEYMVSQAWTVRFEGLYYDFGSFRVTDLTNTGYIFPGRASQFQARVGASYRF